MLVKGDKDRAPYEIPSDVKLQEFALGQVLKEDAFQKVIVGCTHPAQVMENVAIAKKVEESQ
jgi:aryl-alcohol dehydrogenase-like predicted oxidoreductase